MVVGIVGLGIVGNAIRAYFSDAVCYDKYKPSDSFERLLSTDLIFACLPTLYSEETKTYDTRAIEESLAKLSEAMYRGLIVIKSTVAPGTTKSFSTLYPHLNICHCPEFLTARTAVDDFKNQSLIVIGRGKPTTDITTLLELFPDRKTIVCASDESEAAKLFCNSFYAAKIQIFNEFYDACQKTGMAFSSIRDIMISLGWIHPMHTEVPGPDGQLSFGGMCFPKDLSACVSFLKSIGARHTVLHAAKEERDSMRE